VASSELSQAERTDQESMSRRVVVSYRVDASVDERTNALMEGIRECAVELVELGAPTERIVDELEQVANDVEAGRLMAAESELERPRDA
jgi:hypothetical protein